MEGVERKLIAELYEANIEFRRLYDEHLKLHDLLAKYEHRNYLTSEEAKLEKELKLKKLHGREKLLDIIGQYKVSNYREPLYNDAVNY